MASFDQGQRAKEPAVAEFISALAAGNNAQLMVVACASAADSTTLALVAAAHQTGGHVVCIVQGHEELNASKNVLGLSASQVQFMVGEAQELLLNQYEAADFVLIDCNLVNHEEILKAVQGGGNQNCKVVVGYNAFCCRGSWWSYGSKTQLLPIGQGLLVTRFGATATSPRYGPGMGNNRSRWVVKVDKCTGEEHVYRIRFPQGKVILS